MQHPEVLTSTPMFTPDETIYTQHRVGFVFTVVFLIEVCEEHGPELHVLILHARNMVPNSTS